MKKVRFQDKNNIEMEQEWHENHLSTTARMDSSNVACFTTTDASAFKRQSPNDRKDSLKRKAKSKIDLYDIEKQTRFLTSSPRKVGDYENCASNNTPIRDQSSRNFSEHTRGSFSNGKTSIITSSLQKKCDKSFPIERQRDIEYEVQPKNIITNSNELSVIDSARLIAGFAAIKNPTGANHLKLNNKELDLMEKEKNNSCVQIDNRSCPMLNNKGSKNDSTLLNAKAEHEVYSVTNSYLKNKSTKAVLMKNEKKYYGDQNNEGRTWSKNNQHARNESDRVNVQVEQEISSHANGFVHNCDNSYYARNENKKYYHPRTNKSTGDVANDSPNSSNDSADINAQIEHETSILTNYLDQFDSKTMQEIKRIKAIKRRN